MAFKYGVFGFCRRNAIGLLALFVALGGTSMAAKQYVVSSSSQIKDGSIRAQDIAKGTRAALGKTDAKAVKAAVVDVLEDPPTSIQISVKGEKGDKGDQGFQGAQGGSGIQGSTGQQGQQGPQGERGQPGGISYYARVNADGSTSVASGLTVQALGGGSYCIRTGQPIQAAVATIENFGAAAYTTTVRVNPTGITVPGGPCDAIVTTVATSTGTGEAKPFVVFLT